MDLTRSAAAAEYLTAGYNVFVAAVWVAAAPGAPVAAPLAVLHAAAAALPWLLGDAGSRSHLGGRLRDVYPLLCFAAFWTELGVLHTLGGRAWDHVVTALDTRLFGVHLQAVWMPAMPMVWLSELMFAAYVGYYAMMVLPPLTLAVAGRREALQEMVLRVIATYLVCFTVYALAPTMGPTATLPHYEGALTEGFFYRLSHALHVAGNAEGTAFPSSHVAGTVAMAWAAWRTCPRGAAWLLTAEAGAVVLATVYTQNHYPVDALAGLAVALFVQTIGVPQALRLVQAPAPAPRFAPGGFTPTPTPAPRTPGGIL